MIHQGFNLVSCNFRQAHTSTHHQQAYATQWLGSNTAKGRFEQFEHLSFFTSIVFPFSFYPYTLVPFWFFFVLFLVCLFVCFFFCFSFSFPLCLTYLSCSTDTEGVLFCSTRFMVFTGTGFHYLAMNL